MAAPASELRELRGRLALPGGAAVGTVRFGATIVEVALEPGAEPAPELPWITPGFVDVHVHGGGGGDAMDGAEGVRRLARAHLARGSTTLLPTTLTAPWERVLAALEGIAEVVAAAADDPALPSIPGAHLEGPFISPERLGAQPPHTLEPTAERIEAALASGALRVATLAPEVPGARGAARRLAAAGVRVSAGHTRADAEVAAAFYQVVAEAGGTAGATHLFNAMGGIEARAPGTAGAALARRAVFCELICDGHHVAPAAALTALRAKGVRLMLVTDAIRAAVTDADEVTESELGGRPVRIEGGAARLDDGTLAGSTLTMDRALRTLVRFGATVPEAAHAAATAPARYLGLIDRGELRAGLRADLVVLDDALEPRAVVRGGRTVAGEVPAS